MIRQPDIHSAAAMLRAAFSAESAPLAHQKSLNLAAQLQGYKNWAHAKSVLEASAKATPAPLPVPTAVPEAREEELATALEWVCGNYQATLAGKPVRDADECLSYADRLLQRKDSATDAIRASFSPCEVDWVKALAYEDLTHLRVNDKRRELCRIDRDAYNDVARLVDFEFTDRVTRRVVFEYTIAEALGAHKQVRVDELMGAREVEPGVIVLKDGRQLRLLIETEDSWEVYSPALDTTF